MSTTKIIVTSESRLRGKYGANGYGDIRRALERLVAADARRDVTTVIVALDGSDMGKWKSKSSTPRSFKSAIDHAYLSFNRPDYVVILGGPDVVPHQSLKSPLTGSAADEDKDVPSDLPYACDAPDGDAVSGFVAPSRVVSRMPDEQGTKAKASFLVGLIDQAAKWKPPVASGKGYFGLSAEVWEKSTRLSLRALFGKTASPMTSPTQGPKWSSKQLNPRWHFINCHGAPVDPHFYGQKGNQYPVADQADQLRSLVASGTVVAAECCYGAEVCDPAPTTGPGICLAYLEEGAIAFMGSTTIAYGPADSNASADLICRYFLQSCMQGASTGRALLEARQKFVREASPLSPVDLKTLAQFVLLGDACLRAVAPKTQSAAKSTRTKTRAKFASHIQVRGGLTAQAELLSLGSEAARSRGTLAPKSVYLQLARELRATGYVPATKAATFAVTPATDVTARSILSKSLRGRSSVSVTRFHVLQASAPVPDTNDGQTPLRKNAKRSSNTRPTGQVPRRVVLVGREVDGKILHVQRLYAHGGLIEPCLARIEDK